jgi:hypothetical protein
MAAVFPLPEADRPSWQRAVTAESDPKLLSTARNEAHVHDQAKHSLAKVSVAAASGLSLPGAML